MKILPKDKKQLMMAALGRIECDLAIVNGNLVNTFTGEIYKANIFIHEGFVVHVETEDFENINAKNIVDANNAYITPGFIDAHLHIESSLMIPRNFAKAVIPHGTTTVITDPHEIANVYGTKAVEYMCEMTKDLPMRMLVDIPSCIPSVPNLENSGAVFNYKDIEKMLALHNVIGLGEVMDFVAVANAEDRMMDIINVFEKDGRYIQGHAPNLNNRMLSSYLIAGPNTCHESRFSEEVKPKMRNGMYVDARSSSISKNVQTIVEAIDDIKFYDRLTFCTDDREVDEIIDEGHMNDVLRDALKSNFDVVTAIKSATLNAATAIKIDNLGAIAPGYAADVLIIPSLEDLKPSHVFFGGELVAKDGILLAEISDISHEIEQENSVNVKDFTLDDFVLKGPNALNNKCKVNIMEYLSIQSSATKLNTIELPVVDGVVDISDDDTLHYAIIINRYGKGTFTKGVVKNFAKFEHGVGSTVSHDCHNITIVYKKPEDALAIFNKIKLSGGGMAVAKDGNILASLVLNVAGLMSSKPINELSVEVKNMKNALREIGLDLKNPLLRIVTLALPVIPEVKFSDLGLIDVIKQEFIPIFVEE